MSRIPSQKQMFYYVSRRDNLLLKTAVDISYHNVLCTKIPTRLFKFTKMIGSLIVMPVVDASILLKPFLNFEGANSIELVALTEEQRAFLQ